MDETASDEQTAEERTEPVERQQSRYMRVAVEELTLLDWRKMVARAVTAGLPHSSFNFARTQLLRSIGVPIGARSRVQGKIHVTGPGDIRSLLSIGEDTFVTGPLTIDLGAEVHIGDRVHIGLHVTLLTLDHEMGPSELRCGRLVAAPIRIEDGAWLGSRVTVLPGVTIGRGAVVATGSVVTRHVPRDVLVGGIPAHEIRALGIGEAPISRRHPRSPV